MDKTTNWAPNSAESRDLAYHLHPYTNPEQLADSGPHIIESGQGVYVRDSENNEFIEGVSGLWCTSLGFSEESLISAAIEQMRKLPYYHSFGGKTSNPSIDLAEQLLEVAPEQLEKVFNPAYEDIMAICDEMDFETKCGNEFIIKFLEDIVEDYKLLVKQLREEEENEIKNN